MSNIIDTIQVSGVTYTIAGSGGGGGTIDPSLDSGSTNAVANSAITEAVNSKVNIADNNASGYTYESKLKDNYDYGDAFTGPICIKYNGYSGDEGSMFAGRMSIYLSQNSNSYVYLNFDILNGTITGTSTSSALITITIQDGEATIIPASGYYFESLSVYNNFNAYIKIIYSSGQSANVIEDTVYPMFDNLKSEFGKAINYVSNRLNDNGAIETSYKTIDGGEITTVAGNITSSTINAEGSVLNVQFETPKVGQKILNAGNSSFCSLFSKSYNNGYADLTITFNSGYTGGIASNSRYNIGFANSYSSPIYYSAFYNPSTSAFTYESNLTDYCTITDTISTDNKVKITSNEGYRITYFYNSDCSICGVDNQYPEDYIVTLVTTTSNILNGQNVIDDIYSTLSGKQDTLSAGTGIDITNNVISATGGGSITIDPSLDSGSTNAVANSAITTAINAKADVSAVTAVADSLSGYVTTDTAQNITGEKTFVGEKKLKFKQSAPANKIGFTLYNSASTNNELATFEFRPSTYTVGSVQHPLMYIGHYRNTNTANAGVPQTVVGFRQYDQENSAAYHLFAPLPEEAKTPFSLTTSFQNYFIPLGFKVDSSTMVKTDNTGVVDLSSYISEGITSGEVQSMIDESVSGKQDTLISGTNIKTINNESLLGSGNITIQGGGTITIDPSLDSGSTNAVANSAITNAIEAVSGAIPTTTSAVTSGSTDVVESGAVYTQMGGLKLVKLTQTEYDNLGTKDSNTLYVITTS